MMADPSSSSSSSSLLPPGVVFKPTEREILQVFLTRKVHNLPLPNNAIVEMDVYDHQPWLYASGHNYGMDQYGKYYFVRREKKSKCKSETAKNPKRHLKSEGNSSPGGWWKAITGDKPICNKRGHIIGFKKTLKLCTYKNQKYDRKECVKTDWIMHEYKLPHPTFQEWVVCGIRYNGRKGTDQEYASGCHSMLDNQQAQDSNISLKLIDDPSWNEFEDTEGSQVQFPEISFTERELEDVRLYFDLWT